MGTQIASENIAEDLIYCFKTAYHSTVQFPLGSAKRFGEFQILEVWRRRRRRITSSSKDPWFQLRGPWVKNKIAYSAKDSCLTSNEACTNIFDTSSILSYCTQNAGIDEHFEEQIIIYYYNFLISYMQMHASHVLDQHKIGIYITLCPIG